MSQDEQKSGNIASSNAPQGAAASSRPTMSLGSSPAQAGPSRIVGNQAKKQDDVTRQGTQKMKFVPTLPVRRKKPEAEVKQEEVAPSPKPSERGRGRGRGLGRGHGGPPPPRPEIQMTASGPFAMGPALGGSSKRRAPRSNFVPTIPSGAGSASLGEGLSNSGAPTLNRELEKSNKGFDKTVEEDIEVYSDPDEGVQIVDMDAIKTMDWMAPESLRRESDEVKSSKKKRKAEAAKKDVVGQAKGDDAVEAVIKGNVEKNIANALDLSESEEEEEMEDLVDDFAMEDIVVDEDSFTRQEKLYFFQFPHPFPTFTPASDDMPTDVDAMVVDGFKAEIDEQSKRAVDKGKKVSFAQDVKPPAPNGAKGDQTKKDSHESVQKDTDTVAKPTEEKRLDGVIGQLEVHRSGIIKMRLSNGMLMDVTAATQPSFLQHAVSLDPVSKKIHVLGEVNRRFVVSPDIDKLLDEMAKQGAADNIKGETKDVTTDKR